MLTLVLVLAALLVPSASLGAGGERSNRSSAFFGIDGLMYDLSPSVIPGVGDEEFYGPDFDLACGYGNDLRAGMRNLSKLAQIIERSGRRVVFTVVPNKSSAELDQVDPAQLPHGDCDLVGLREQRKLLERYRDPRYVSLPRLLERDKRKVFWDTDLHWTTVGASVFSKALATKLDRKLGAHQSYRPGPDYTSLGGLNALLHDPQQETVPSAVPARSVKVSPRVVSQEGAYDHTWRTVAKQGTWPGHTVVVGDSMMSVALSTLRAAFSHGRFLWLQHVPTQDIVHAIASADTVVFETIQLFVPVVELGSRQFRAQVKKALRHG
jgi:hypothetical protein